MTRPVLPAALRLPAALVILLWFVAGCSTGPVPNPSAPAISQQPSIGRPAPANGSTVTDPTVASVIAPTGASVVAPTVAPEPSPMRQGTVAKSARLRFVPLQIELPSGRSAVVEPEQTVDGVLQIPVDVQHVGWWDGSAEAGDPFGATVIAGHVDSRLQGLGFFAELLVMQVGDLITLRSETADLSYRVVSATLVDKQALASDNQALDQRGPHRLVLITCSGQWQPEERSYDSNLVLIADPLLP